MLWNLKRMQEKWPNSWEGELDEDWVPLYTTGSPEYSRLNKLEVHFSPVKKGWKEVIPGCKGEFYSQQEPKLLLSFLRNLQAHCFHPQSFLMIHHDCWSFNHLIYIPDWRKERRLRASRTPPPPAFRKTPQKFCPATFTCLSLARTQSHDKLLPQGRLGSVIVQPGAV